MSKEKNEKWLHYTVLINNKIAELFDGEDGELMYQEMEDDENFKHFLHALSNAVPCAIFNKFTQESKNLLEFNHIANHIVFEFAKNQENEDDSSHTG